MEKVSFLTDRGGQLLVVGSDIVHNVIDEGNPLVGVAGTGYHI